MSLEETPDPAVEPETSEESVVPQSRPWLTCLLFLVISIAYIVVSVIAVLCSMALESANNPNFDMQTWAEGLESNGLFYSVVILSGAIVLTPAIIAITFIFDNETPLRYLGFQKPSAKAVLWSVISVLLMVAVSDGLTLLLGNDVVPQFMHDAYNSSGSKPLFWLALIVAAPLVEEIAFRGFLYRGFVYSRLGLIGTAIITSLFWALLHTQYNAHIIGMIFIVGLVLCYVRRATQSVVPCILMHSIMNLIATIEVAIAVAE